MQWAGRTTLNLSGQPLALAQAFRSHRRASPSLVVVGGGFKPKAPTQLVSVAILLDGRVTSKRRVLWWRKVQLKMTRNGIVKGMIRFLNRKQLSTPHHDRVSPPVAASPPPSDWSPQTDHALPLTEGVVLLCSANVFISEVRGLDAFTPSLV